MEKIGYKKFISISKYVVQFNRMNLLGRIIFYLESPIMYARFKKTYKEAMKGKIEKKEVK